MKKFTFLLFLLLPLLHSCSSDDSATDSTVILLKKAVSLSNGPSPNVVIDYHYSGRKMDKISIGSIEIRYTYESDLITKSERYSNNQLTSRVLFAYDSNERLVSEIYHYDLLNNSAEKYEYTYNTDSTVSYNRLEGNLTTQNTLIQTGKIYLNSNQEPIQLEIFNQGNLSLKFMYTYGDKKNVFQNVIGFNKQFIRSPDHSLRNHLSTLTYDGNNNLIDSATYSSVFNSDDFPIDLTSVLNNNPPSVSQYFYN
ncbi:MAG: hypothetical protein V4648_10030 [Bacteroidota bacterium]